MPALRVYRFAQMCLALCAGTVLASSLLHSADRVQGSFAYKGTNKSYSVQVSHAYLVSGPDMFEESKTVRRLILSGTDFSSAIRESEALNGFDGKLMEGMIVELTGGPRLNYWVVLGNQMVQYSGTVEPSALVTTTDVEGHLAGHLKFDDSSAGGAKVDIDFDVNAMKTFARAR